MLLPISIAPVEVELLPIVVPNPVKMAMAIAATASDCCMPGTYPAVRVGLAAT